MLFLPSSSSDFLKHLLIVSKGFSLNFSKFPSSFTDYSKHYSRTLKLSYSTEISCSYPKQFLWNYIANVIKASKPNSYKAHIILTLYFKLSKAVKGPFPSGSTEQYLPPLVQKGDSKSSEASSPNPATGV
mmetsp:Transcript_14654/g.1328  ORF Transcript_14654/g.1328 Transcript_14654/m.1328 type:complete len:130 (+) Transcript_14654:447-836(+)